MSEISVASASRIGLWIRAIRPRTLGISLAPVVVAIAHAHAAYGRIAWVPVVAASIAALAIQIATNLANDAADGERGLDGPGRLGPQRIAGSGLMPAADVRRGAIVATIAAVATGLVAVVHGGLPILLIGVASILAAWAYSSGPRPISASPFGELFVVAFFGVAAVVGIEWLAAGAIGLEAVGLGIAIGLPAAAVLTVNNHRDRAADTVAGRRTLAIVLGERGTIAVYALELFAAVALAAGTVAMRAPLGAAIFAVATVPAAVAVRRLAGTPVGRALNRHLGATAGFQMLLALLTAAVLGGLS